MPGANVAIEAPVWHARAALCELLAISFRYPTIELAEALHSGEWADAAAELVSACGSEVPCAWNRERLLVGFDEKPCGDAEALLRSLRAEATRLFVGAPIPVASPYEGVWAALDDGVQPLLFVNPRSREVERFCRACGLGHPAGTNEPLDHIATELELMQYLASVAAGLVPLPESALREADLPGGSAADAHALFVAEHASAWMPRFAEAVGKESRLPFYRFAAELLPTVCR